MAKTKAPPERQKYFDGFSAYAGVFEAFGSPADFPKEHELLFAIYEQEGYEGSAFVLFARGRTLYEASGSHCSCNGLEDCWDPEETSAAAILMRPDLGLRGCWPKQTNELRLARDSLLQALGLWLDPAAQVPEAVPVSVYRRAIKLAGFA